MNYVKDMVDNMLIQNESIEEEAANSEEMRSAKTARAGEAGRGVSVVANEIKKLAENSKKSANYIKDTVKSLREEISSSEQAIIEAVDIFSKE